METLRAHHVESAPQVQRVAQEVGTLVASGATYHQEIISHLSAQDGHFQQVLERVEPVQKLVKLFIPHCGEVQMLTRSGSRATNNTDFATVNTVQLDCFVSSSMAIY
jgi:hypothetical protein